MADRAPESPLPSRADLHTRDATKSLRIESELRQANRDLSLVSAINKAIVSSRAEIDLFERVCLLMQGGDGFAAAFVRSLRDGELATCKALGGEWGLDEAIDALGLDPEEREAALRLEWKEPKTLQPQAKARRPVAGASPGLEPSPWKGAIYLPLSHRSDFFGALFLFSRRGIDYLEERRGHLLEIAEDVAFGMAAHRQEVARRKAEQLAARRLRIERALAQYSSELLIGSDHGRNIRAGMRRLMVACEADEVFLYEVRDDLLNAGLADRVCQHSAENAPKEVATPEQISLEGAAGKDPADPATWCRALQLELEPQDELLAFPLLSGGRCLGVVGYLFLDRADPQDPAMGTILRFAAQLMSELHERSRSDRRLKLLATAMDSSDEGILVSNAAERFEISSTVLVNEGLCRMSGYARETFLGRSPAFLLSDGCRLDVQREALEAERTPVRGKAHFRRKDGSQYLAEYAVYPIFTDNGEIAQYLCIYRDITERQQLESRLAFANKMESIGQLSAGIAHEINTPSQFIGDNLRFLKDAWERIGPLARGSAPALEDPRESRRLQRMLDGIPEAIDDACEGVERISTIVKAMREFSHPEKRFVLADLNRCVTTTATVARNEWKYVADLSLDLEESLPAAEMLPGDINQVLLNLIVNAAHAIAEKLGESGGKGRIEIATRRAGDSVQVSVADTGNGIPEEIQKSVFDPFFTTKEVGKGTGQGLYMAHVIVEQRHGGRLWLESEPGQGAVFHLQIPVSNRKPSHETD